MHSCGRNLKVWGSLSMSPSWYTASKAFCISSRHMVVGILLFKLLTVSVLRVKNAWPCLLAN